MSDSITPRDLPLGIEVRHLAALDAIARTSSFSQAAVELGYAQSAVSQQIATLERAVGHRLVERPGGPRPVSLTEAGKLLHRHAAHITARLGAVRADLDAFAAGEAGTVRVGSFQSASARLLPPTVARFRQSWSRVSVELRNELNCADIDGLVQSGQLDVAFSDVSTVAEALDAIELVVDPYVAIVPPGSPFSEAADIDLGAFHGARMITSTVSDACTIRVAKGLEAARAQPVYVFRSDDNLTLQRLVAAGVGVAVVPLLAVEQHVPDAAVVILPLAPGSEITRRIGVVWHRDRHRSAAAIAFVDTACEVAASLDLPALPAPVAAR
jgi:DNA-binding transcriptional LysR family regulator